MSTDWERFLSAQRIDSDGRAVQTPREDPLRSEPGRDWDRVVFSESFRRLHDKTQVFPLSSHDSVHSRLTHSLEVASVGRSLGNAVGFMLRGKEKLPNSREPRDVGDIVAAACLAHDIGNPPFGHSGENAIGSYFKTLLTDAFAARWELTLEQSIDLKRFEGNAQGFRILTRIGMPESRGMRLTSATMAAFMKYPRPAGADLLDAESSGNQPADPHRKKPGIFQRELEIAKAIANEAGLRSHPDGGWFRHPLAWLVEAADDICYRILDLEDGVRLKLIDLQTARDQLFNVVRSLPSKDANGDLSGVSPIGRLRASAIDALLRRVVEIYEGDLSEIESGRRLKPLTDETDLKPHLASLKGLVSEHCYDNETVLEIELSGYEILHSLLRRFIPAALLWQGAVDQRRIEGSRMNKWQDTFLSAHHSVRVPNQDEARKLLQRLHLFEQVRDAQSAYEAMLLITDYVSGMTDSFAVTLYRHLHGTSLPGHD